MINIFRTEFFRLKHNKLFWVLFGVCGGLPVLGILLSVFITAFFGGMGMDVEVDVWVAMRLSNIPGQMLAEFPSLMSDNAMLSLICASIFISAEFSFGTVRNMVLARRSRTEIYFSLLITAVIIAVAYLSVSFATTLLFSASIFGFGSMSVSNAFTAIITSFTLGIVSVIFVQSMMCMFLFCTRKLAPALALPLVICFFVPSVLVSIVQFVAVFKSIGDELFMPDLSWVPLYNSSMFDFTSKVDGALVGKVLLYNIPLSALFITLGWVSFRKADLK